MTSTEHTTTSVAPDRPDMGRRRFVTFLVAAPTLTVAARLGIDLTTHPSAFAAGRPSAASSETTTETDLGTTYVLRVTSDNRIVFESPKADVGQGISTALSMLIAEDLDARLTDVRTELADAANLPGQSVGGSLSIRDAYDPVREMAAQARARLVTAAARRWGVDADTLTTHDTAVHAPDGRSETYGALAADAANVTDPEVSTAPKPFSEHTVIGSPASQQEGRAIVTGAMTFSLDVPVADALPTVVARPPTIYGTVESVDASATTSMSGVIAVTTIPTGVAVTARSFHEAMRGRDALRVTWGPGPVDDVSDSTINERLAQAIPPFADPPLLSNHVDGRFEFAFVNHAPMETNAATADVRPTSAVVWSSTKVPNSTRRQVAEAIGYAEDAVTVHVTRGGGSFGRRLSSEAQIEAARVSHALGRPVKLMWTRDDDTRHGRMRPASMHRMRITYLAGEMVSFENLSSAVQLDFGVSSVITGIDPGALGYPSIGSAFFALTQHTPYALGTEAKELNEVPLKFPTATWRSVYSGHNRAAEELMMDRLASKLGKDPLGLRISLAKDQPAKALLRRLRTESGWGSSLPAGWAHGVGYHEEYDGRAGCVVTIDATDPKAPRVMSALVVADMGIPVNPRGLEAQFMGSVMDGIGTILRAGNHIDNGSVRESSFADFAWPRQRHAPRDFRLVLMPATGTSIAGAGEIAVPAAAAAVASAFGRATGTQPWRFPLTF
ncbi:molybdopterin cofactor-binding domain-containing protein [Haloechinothrix salitolerans]|uniref:Molybdopterin cofactor-binding domain-containing protein n=1 Tax=Haloechinothrix salitolerans TaxID=926830 RepID=A0ABW2BYS7_9PSEU